MEEETRNRLEQLEKSIESLRGETAELRSAVPGDSLALGLISGHLDRVLAAFIIALGAAAYDMEVHMFFSFWSIAALRDPKKKASKNLLGKMFGWMLPNGSRKLKLSSLNMAGAGPMMIRGLMKRKGVPSLEEMIRQAGELGIEIHVCEMSMDLMGFKKEEMIDYPHMSFVGVGTFLGLAQSARQAFFL